MGSTLPEPGEAVAVVRFRRGVVGETRRVCHVVPVPSGDEVPERLTAYCGQHFRPGQAELLTQIAGMPCEACLAISARALAPAGLLPALR